MTDSEQRDHIEPDNTTLDLAIYGTKWPDVTKAFFNIDRMIDDLILWNESLKETMDWAFCQTIIVSVPDYMEMDDAKVPKVLVEKMRMLRDYTKNHAAIKLLRYWRAEVDLWGRFHGARERGRTLSREGIPGELWAIASNYHGQRPICFDTLREVSL